VPVTTTPTELSDQIVEVCSRAVWGSVPIYVDVAPRPGAAIGQCYYNVEDVVVEAGGCSRFGWIIWQCGQLYVELEHHTIWQLPSGDLMDITPKSDGEAQIAFLPDPKSRFYTRNPKWLDNQRFTLSSDPRVQSFLVASSKLSRFVIRHSRPNGRLRETVIPRPLVAHYENLRETKEQAFSQLREML
jgi:hypothetical protein